MSDQAKLFPGHGDKRAEAERLSRAWFEPEPGTAPAPRWIDERFREVDPGTWPALPTCSKACPWRKPQRVILAQRALEEDPSRSWPHADECRHPDKRVAEVELDETCWPMLAERRLSSPPATEGAEP
jgi:hypothetical protein